MEFGSLILGILGTWRITHLFAAEDGPFRVMAWLRQKAGSGFWGELLDCFYCLSLWVSAPFAFLLSTGVKNGVLQWLAFSAGAILLERVTNRDDRQPPVYYEEPVGGEHGVLRAGGIGSTGSEPHALSEVGAARESEFPPPESFNKRRF